MPDQNFWWFNSSSIQNNGYLDWFNPTTPYAHPVFGKVIDGLDVIQAIQAVPTDGRDNPHFDDEVDFYQSLRE